MYIIVSSLWFVFTLAGHACFHLITIITTHYYSCLCKVHIVIAFAIACSRVSVHAYACVRMRESVYMHVLSMLICECVCVYGRVYDFTFIFVV